MMMTGVAMTTTMMTVLLLLSNDKEEVGAALMEFVRSFVC